MAEAARQNFAIIVEGGAARDVLPERAHDEARGDGSLLWLHLHGASEDCDAWLAAQGDIPAQARAALTAAETRPRCEPMGKGALVNLRGIGDASLDSADPLVSIRMWMERGRVVSVVQRDMNAVETVRDIVSKGRVSDPGELVAALGTAISTQLDAVVADTGDRLDDVEEALAAGTGDELRQSTSAIRAQAIAFRRFVAPERSAFQTLSELGCDWLDHHDRADLREAANRFARMTEELEAIRERAALVGEQLTEARAEVMERRSFLLGIVALIFLPLTFFTGLLGINVEGIWYAEHPFAFNGVLLICLAMTVVLSVYFVVAHWFRK